MTRGQNPDNGADTYLVPALARGLRLLEEFRQGSRTLGAPELARRLDLPRATVFRILSTLEHMGFLERLDGGGEYRLGMAVLRLYGECVQLMEADADPRAFDDRRYGFQTLNQGISR